MKLSTKRSCNSILSIEQITQHEQEISSGRQPKDLEACPRCKAACKYFKRHGKRHRFFLVITDGLVRKITSFLGRWKCYICKRIFTYYPPYALPYKRYLKEHILARAQNYVEDDAASYRTAVEHEGVPIGYDGRIFRADTVETCGLPPLDDSIDERFLARQTVWKWLSFFGGLNNFLKTILDLIRQKAPSSTIFRDIRPIAKRKYRSLGRRKALNLSRTLLLAEKEFQELFERSIFSMM